MFYLASCNHLYNSRINNIVAQKKMYYNNSEYPTYKNPNQSFYNVPSSIPGPYTYVDSAYHHHHIQHRNQPQPQPQQLRYNYQSSTSNYQSIHGINYAATGHKSKPHLTNGDDHQVKTTKPRSKTWDKIKSLTNGTKRNKNCNHRYHEAADQKPYMPR
jgi:hypothetical protein